MGGRWWRFAPAVTPQESIHDVLGVGVAAVFADHRGNAGPLSGGDSGGHSSGGRQRCGRKDVSFEKIQVRAPGTWLDS